MDIEQKHIDRPMSLLEVLRLRQGGRYVFYYFGMARAFGPVFSSVWINITSIGGSSSDL